MKLLFSCSEDVRLSLVWTAKSIVLLWQFVLDAEVNVLQQLFLVAFDEPSQVRILWHRVVLPLFLVGPPLRRSVLLLHQTGHVSRSRRSDIHASESLIHGIQFRAIYMRIAYQDRITPPIKFHPRQALIALLHHVTADGDVGFHLIIQ